MSDAITITPAPYVTVPLAALMTGFTAKAIERKIQEGVWLEGREYRRAPDGRILISTSKVKMDFSVMPRMVQRVPRKRRAPQWADHCAIQAVYDNARRMSEETGIEYQVDHIVPINGRLVSGLHVHQNLQVLTMVQNRAKGNRFEVEP